MAILTDDTIKQITQAVKTAKIFNIESFIIEPNIIRGIDEGRTVAIFDDNLSIDIDCSIGINRLDILSNRLTLFEGFAGNTIECIIDNNTNEAQSLVIRIKKAKVEYKCAKIKAIKAPKEIQVPREYKMDIGDDVVNMIIKADTAMKAETINVICNDDIITYQFIDANNDMFEWESGNTMVNLINDNPSNLSYRYPVKLVMLALKHNTSGNFYITYKGMLNTDVNGYNIYIPSKQ